MHRTRKLIAILLMIISIRAGAQKMELTFRPMDTLRSFCIPKHAPWLYSVRFKHEDATMWNKIVRGTLYSSALNVTTGAGLTMSSEQITKWYKKDKFTVHSIADQYWKSFTTPPVVDNDLFVIDYIGHPCQGSIYYNSLRAQGATQLQSALFCTVQSTLWEYGWEGGIEQPSIQDLIITPIGGILFGELSHVFTIMMSRNGFRWYERVLVCIINPIYAINNGFKPDRYNGDR